MPVRLQGIDATKRAMKEYTPDLYNEMNKEIKEAMLTVRDHGRAFVPFTTMYGWEHQKGTWAGRQFNATSVKKGIVYKMGKTAINKKGFRGYYSVVNKTAAGAIFETAGRKNPAGQPWAGKKKSGNKRFSHSSNPRAGQQFIANLDGVLVGSDKQKGRLIYRAWAKDNSIVIPKTLKAIEKATIEFNKRAKP